LEEDDRRGRIVWDRFEQPSPYEIRTRVFKAEVEDIDMIKATHMSA